MDAYSQLKPAWHLDRIQALRSLKAPVPVHVQLILSDLCNQDCSFCAYRMSGGLSTELFGEHNPNRKMPTDRALEILETGAARGVKAIQFTGGGEPTVHADHELVFARAQALGLDTGLVTNGVRLAATEPFLRMKWVRVSVDAGTPETYARVRGVSEGHWHKVWQNIKAFRPMYDGALGVGFVVTPDNWREIEQCALLCAEAGVDSLRIGAVFSAQGLGYYGTELGAITAECERVEALAAGSGLNIISLFGRRIGDLLDGRPDYEFCGYQHFTTYIGADLSVYRCCNTSYTTRGWRASLKYQSFADYLDFLTLDDFDARGCRFCQFNGQNRAIQSLLDEPTHANFV